MSYRGKRLLIKSLLVIFCVLQIHLTALDPTIFSRKLNEPTPDWMIEQIEHDLTPFKKELSQKYLDDLFAKNGEAYYLVRVRVISGQLTIQTSQRALTLEWVPNIIIPHLQAVHKHRPLPDIDFIFSGRDFLAQGNEEHNCQLPHDPILPIFIMSKCKQDKGLILFPDWFALRGFEPDKSQVLEGNKRYPWDSKRKILFFRGADSGAWDSTNWTNSPRPKIMFLSVKHPDLIDAKFPYLLTYQGDNQALKLKKAKKAGLMGKFVPMREHPRYRYLMDIDGHCAATPRFPLLLHSNSVIFKNMTNSMLWFYGTIKPYVHFIPVAEDLSDLLTQLAWAKSHDDECKKISQNARQLAAEVLSQEVVYLYLYRVLEAYSAKQQEFYLE